MAALTEEQMLLKEQAKTWANEEAPVAQLRAMRDSGNEAGFDKGTWNAIGELGWAGIVVPEDLGGVDMGHLTFGVVLEELGRQLTASPLLASGLIGANALRIAGTEGQQQAWLPRIAEGAAIVTLAVDEGTRHAPDAIALSAIATGDGYRLDGEKVHVLEGLTADAYVVAARTAGQPGSREGLSLFLVDAESNGITRAPRRLADSRGYADVRFSGVEVGADALMGTEGAAGPALEQILDHARAGLAAEMLGTAAQSFDMTLEYLKTRVQFGSVIGSFQALGHRAAALFTEMELARSCVEAALQAIDASEGEHTERIAALCSLSKATAGDFLHHMSNELLQIHGGIGMTDEFDAGLYLKRARTTAATFGNQSFHRDRYATLKGF